MKNNIINFNSISSIEDLQFVGNKEKPKDYKVLKLLINSIDEIAFPFKEERDKNQLTQSELAKFFIISNISTSLKS